MVATVGSISIDLSTNAVRFEQGFRRAATTVERESGRMSRSVANVERNLASLSRSVTTFGGAFAGGFATREIVRYADAWTEAGNKVRAAGEISGRQGRSIQQLNDIATETRSGLTETVDLYAKLLRATEGVAKSEGEVARATEIVNKAFKAGGAAASEQVAGILQLSQALGSGLLQGDELRSIRENAPLLAQAIANEFNTTIAGLKELGAAGEITSERVFKAILAAQGSIEAAFDQTTATIGDGITRIKNAAVELIGTLSEISGGAGSLSGEFSRFGADLENAAAGLQNLSNNLAAFAQNPSLDQFFNFFETIRRGEGGGIADRLLGDRMPEVIAEIAKVEEQLAKAREHAESLAVQDPDFSHFHKELEQLRAELHRLEIDGHGAFAAMARSAEDASMKALEAIRAVDNADIKDKNVNINVRTNYEVGGGGTIGVTRLDTLSAAERAERAGKSTVVPSGPTLRQVNVSDFLAAGRGFASGGIATKASIFGEAGPEAAVPLPDGRTIPVTLGGSSYFRNIDENTFLTYEEVKRSIGYLETIEKNQQASLTVLNKIAENALKSAGIATGGGVSSGGGSGGFSSGGSGGYSFNDPKSPYYYNGRMALPGGAQYNPVADFMYNGNQSALAQVAGSGYGMYEATPWNNPGAIGGHIRGGFQSNVDLANALRASGPSVGAYGGGYNITADSDFLSGGGMFADGSRFEGSGMGEYDGAEMAEARAAANLNTTINIMYRDNPTEARSMMELEDRLRAAWRNAPL